MNNINTLTKKRDALNARIKLIQNRESSIEKKNDMRRKILVGTYYLEEVLRDGSMPDLTAKMDAMLVRDSDRKLFGLKEVEKRQNKAATEK